MKIKIDRHFVTVVDGEVACREAGNTKKFQTQ
jgi:hypothetical protein